MTTNDSRYTTSAEIIGSNVNGGKECSFGDGPHKECRPSSSCNEDSSESMRNLTDDVIHVREDVEIRFDAGLRMSISSSSVNDFQTQIIWDGARGQHSWRAN